MDTAGCFGKIAYANRADAEKARRHLYVRSNFTANGALHCYHCAHCGSFHLGRERRDGANLNKGKRLKELRYGAS